MCRRTPERGSRTAMRGTWSKTDRKVGAAQTADCLDRNSPPSDISAGEESTAAAAGSTPGAQSWADDLDDEPLSEREIEAWSRRPRSMREQRGETPSRLLTASTWRPSRRGAEARAVSADLGRPAPDRSAGEPPACRSRATEGIAGRCINSLDRSSIGWLSGGRRSRNPKRRDRPVPLIESRRMQTQSDNSHGSDVLVWGSARRIRWHSFEHDRLDRASCAEGGALDDDGYRQHVHSFVVCIDGPNICLPQCLGSS